MGKRILAAFLWFFAGWYLGAYIAYMFDLSELIGPVIGAMLAALVAGDPAGLIWQRRRQVDRTRAVAKARLADLPALH